MNEHVELALEAILLLLVPALPTFFLYRKAKDAAVEGVWKKIRVQITGPAALYVILVGLLYYCIIRPFEARKNDDAVRAAQEKNRQLQEQVDRLTKENSELKGRESSTTVLNQRIEQLVAEKEKTASESESLRRANALLEDQTKKTSANLSKLRQLWRVTGHVQVTDKHGNSIPIDTSKVIIYPDRPPDIRNNGAFVLWVYKTYNEAGVEEFPVLKFTYGNFWPATVALNGIDIGEFYNPEFHDKDDPPYIALLKPIVLRPAPPVQEPQRLGSK